MCVAGTWSIRQVEYQVLLRIFQILVITLYDRRSLVLTLTHEGTSKDDSTKLLVTWSYGGTAHKVHVWKGIGVLENIGLG